MMSNSYRQEDISSALSELMESPYANSDPFLYSLGAKDCLKLVKNMVDGKVSDSLKIPVADVRENVRGEWRERKDIYPHKPDGEITSWSYRCSCCNQLSQLKYDFCFNCGADMRGVYDDPAV